MVEFTYGLVVRDVAFAKREILELEKFRMRVSLATAV